MSHEHVATNVALASVQQKPQQTLGAAFEQSLDVLIIGCGGTISGAAGSTAFAPVKRVKELINRLPTVTDCFNVTAVDRMMLDSSDIDPTDWGQLAEWIDHNHDNFDAIICTSGTDALVELASALALAGSNVWQKPVILTGAQRPIDHETTDAKDNLDDAFSVARSAVDQEVAQVMLAFHGLVLAPLRATKVSTGLDQAFQSPGYPPLTTRADGFAFGAHAQHRGIPQPFRRPCVFNPGVKPLLVGSSTTTKDVDRLAYDPDVRGVVLVTRKSGSVPHRIIPALQRAIHSRGLPIVTTTSIPGQQPEAVYLSAQRLESVGAIPANGVPAEVAQVKLSFLLGQGLGLREIRRAFRQSYAGELVPFEPSGRLQRTTR